MRLYTNALLAAAAVAGIASSAQALVWTSPNIPDEKTIALYHFDEGTGTVAANDAGTAYPSINLTANGSWSSNTNWQTSPSGSSLASDGTGFGGATATVGALDWSLPGITISMWMRVDADINQDNFLFHISYGTWRNVQAFAGFHTQWRNYQHLRMDGVTYGVYQDNNAWLETALDGEWHHVALVYDNAADTASFYYDNVKQAEWSVAGGYQETISEFLNVAKFNGQVDELLIQGEVMTDFSDGLNVVVPEPASLALLGLVPMALMRRRRA